MTGPGGENRKMKGKKFIAIMAIFIILCSIQAITAFENNNMTQSDVLAVENIQVTDTAVSQDSNESGNHPVEVQAVHNPKMEKSSSMDSDDLLQSSPASENILGAVHTGGIFIYTVDYDSQYRDVDEVPLERFFKAVYWGIRDYMQNNGNASTEWDVFLCNKTFTGGYGDAGVGTIPTGYLSPDGHRVTYLTFNSMNYNSDVALTIHLYGGYTKDDGLTSTLDLTNYGADCAIIDFSMPGSSIKGINFKNFNVNNHAGTEKPGSTVPFVKLGDKSKPDNSIDDLIQDCSFENIVLNPNQPLYEVGDGVVKDLYFSDQYSDSSLSNLVKFIFWRVRDAAKNGILDYNIFLCNNTFTGGYGADGVGTISTGYYSWDNDGYAGRANYITFRNLDSKTNEFSYNRNITLHIYGGWDKDDGKTSTIDLSKYGADYRFMDLSGGSSTITGVNFKNFDVNNYDYIQSEDTSMPFIFLGDNKIQNYNSSLINCTFENITLNKKQPIVRMAFLDSPQDSSVIMKSGGTVDGCTFRNNSASQMLVIAGSRPDSSHTDDGPIFTGFKANNNVFVNI